jgi:hypothetical protein
MNVHSLHSYVRIPKQHFDDIISDIKGVFKNNKKVASKDNLADLLKMFNWEVRYDIITGNISSLKFEAEHWDLKSNIILKEIAKYVLPGSFIKMANENISTYWVFKFENKELHRQTLIKELIDFDSISQMERLFNRSAKNIIRLGGSPDKLHKIIDSLFVQSILD